MRSLISRLPFAAKLALAFTLTVLIGVGAVAVVANASAQRHFESYVSTGAHPRLMSLVPSLSSFYAATGSWEGVEEVVNQALPASGMGRGRSLGQGGRAPVVITDASRRVVYDSETDLAGERLSRGTMADAQEIEVNGKTVGYAIVSTGPLEMEFSRSLNRSIAAAGVVASLVAIGLALLLTRSVVRPIRALRNAAQQIASGDLTRRVVIASEDEIGELAEGFNDMAAKLERDEELRRKMMADISHELRTPLAVMQAQVEALTDGVFDLTVENLEPISGQTQLLGRLVNDLREMALAEAGRLQLQQTEMDLSATIRRVVEAFQPRAQEKAIQLTAALEAELPPVMADSQRLEQVLGNLLGNAVRHTQQGGAIDVRSRRDGDDIVFAVADNGPGIPAEDLPYVFERFYRADKARARSDGGTGLGLAISKQIVEAHGGSISVASQPGRGATFEVRIPALSG